MIHNLQLCPSKFRGSRRRCAHAQPFLLQMGLEGEGLVAGEIHVPFSFFHIHNLVYIYTHIYIYVYVCVYIMYIFLFIFTCISAYIYIEF